MEKPAEKQTVVSVRLMVEDLKTLQQIALVEGQSVGEVVRIAVRQHAEKVHTEEFQAKARQRKKELFPDVVRKPTTSENEEGSRLHKVSAMNR